MESVLGIATVLVMSVLKFMFTGLVSYGFGHSYWFTVLLTAVGACAGTVFFYVTGVRVLEWFRLRFIHRQAERKARGLRPRKIFTRTNRFIVRIKRSYGLPGLAIMPPILSIPITSVLAAKYFRHDRRTLPLLLSAVLVWSVVLSTAWGFLR